MAYERDVTLLNPEFLARTGRVVATRGKAMDPLMRLDLRENLPQDFYQGRPSLRRKLPSLKHIICTTQNKKHTKTETNNC